MNRVKAGFCLFLFVLSCFYLKDILKDLNILDYIPVENKESSFKKFVDVKLKEPSNLLNINNKIIPKEKKEGILNGSLKIENDNNNDPIVYIFNTHQTEEYAKNAYNITPTVVTASNILSDELHSLGISSIVENKDIIKETKRRGYDYTGTYTVSFEYLKERKKENDSLEYFFDIHRDSITGDVARTKIKNKNYATIMFLVGANYDGYEVHVNNSNIMKSYLDKNYPGLVRNTYIQKKSSFYQYYSPKMFLVEVGGPDNTLEEVYNSTKALAESINYYIKEDKWKRYL